MVGGFPVRGCDLCTVHSMLQGGLGRYKIKKCRVRGTEGTGAAC